MKKIHSILAIAAMCSAAIFAQATDPPDCKCDFTQPGNQVLDNNKLKAQPGQTVCIKSGTYTWMYIQNFKGTKDAPIRFVNMCDGKVVFAAGKGGGRTIYAINDQFVHMDGSNNPNEKYGFEISGNGQGIDFRDLSSDIELNNWWFHDIGYSGFNAKTDPTCDLKTQRRTPANPAGFVMGYVKFHDNKLERIMTGEAAYVGESHYADGVERLCGLRKVIVQEHDVESVEFYNNEIRKIGRDGIQIGSARKCMVYNNTIDGFGMTAEYGQMSGIQINPGTKAEVYHNSVRNGPGFAIFAGGTGGNYIHDNVIDSVGSRGDGGGLFSVAYGVVDKAGNRFENNKLTNVQRVGIELYSLTYDIGNTFTYVDGAAPVKFYTSQNNLIKGTIATQKVLTLDSAGITKVFLISDAGVSTRIK